MSSESHAVVVLHKEEGLPLIRDKARGLQRLLNAERRVVHVVLQVVEREGPLRVEGRAVGDVVVADVRAHLHRVLRPGPRERVRELIGVGEAPLREIAVAADLEEAGESGGRTVRIVLREIEIAPHQREPELVQLRRGEDVRVAGGEIRVYQFLVRHEPRSEVRSADSIVRSIVQRVPESEVVVGSRVVVAAAEIGLVQAGIDDRDIGVADFDRHAIHQLIGDVAEHQVIGVLVLQERNLLTNRLPACGRLPAPERHASQCCVAAESES